MVIFGYYKVVIQFFEKLFKNFLIAVNFLNNC